MQEPIRQIAERIKGLREIYGLTAETLARELGVPAPEYHAYEAGEADIPVGVLFKAAHRFGVELTELLTGEQPRLRTYALTRKGRGVTVERRRQYRYQSLAHNFVHKKAEPFLVTVDPEPADAPFHLNSHPGQEFSFVLEGSLRVRMGEHEVTLEEGDSLLFDSAVEHGVKALGGKPARFLAVIL